MAFQTTDGQRSGVVAAGVGIKVARRPLLAGVQPDDGQFHHRAVIPPAEKHVVKLSPGTQHQIHAGRCRRRSGTGRAARRIDRLHPEFVVNLFHFKAEICCRLELGTLVIEPIWHIADLHGSTSSKVVRLLGTCVLFRMAFSANLVSDVTRIG